MRRLLSLIALVVVGSAVPVEAVTRTVCIGVGVCNHETVQAAVNAAGSGDVITVKAGETFIETVTLPNKGTLATPITIRSDTADANLPAAGYRIFPTTAQLAFLPTIKAPVGGLPTFITAVSARDYILLGLNLGPNPGGFNEIVRLGTNTTAQEFESQQPQNITLDRVIIRGDPVFGQKTGVQLNGKNLTIKNSYIGLIAGVGQDAIGVGCINGTGPLFVLNNYIQSAAENMICGGADPEMRTFAEVVAGATTTGATLTTFRTGHTIATLAVGQRIAVLAGTNTTRYHTYVRSITGNAITYDAIPAAPDTGAGSDIRWGAVLTGITVQRNHFIKDTAWMNPILATPASVTATPSTAAGTLAAGTYYYRVVAKQQDGYTNNSIYSTAATEVSATLSATGQVALSWAAVANASHYRVYGRATGAPTGYLETTGTTLTDTGAALTTGTIPTATKWQVKNLFEIKFGLNWQIDGNIFEYAWPGADIGYGIWLKSNSAGSCEHCQTKDVIFENNIIRHVPGFFNILARINGSGYNWSAVLENLTIRNNLGYDSNSNWLQGGSSTYAFKIEGGVKGLTIEHNTLINTMRGFVYLTAGSGGLMTGFVLKNNLARAETYGIFGGGCVKGTNCLDVMTPGWVMAGNAVAGASASAYPANNVYPTVTEFETLHFTNYGGGVNGDYSLLADSTWKLTATDGTDRGANIGTVITATNGVIEGTPVSTPAPVNITTTGLVGGTVSTAYTATVVATGGTTPYTFTLDSGTLPAGLSLATTGVISGTPTTAGTSTFVIKVTDSTSGTAQTDTQALSITIVAAVTTLNITTTTLGNGTVPVPYTATVVAMGGTAPYTLALSAGTLPGGLMLAASTGVISGVPLGTLTTSLIDNEVSSFTVQVTDAGGGTATKALTLTVLPEPLPCGRPIDWNYSQAITFRRTTAPTSADCVAIGDTWINTSTTPAQRYVATSTTPTWVVLDAQAHALLSTVHTDAVPGTPVDGDLIVGTDANTWTRFPIGQAGTVLGSAGDTPTWTFDGSKLTGLNATELTTGTVPAARLGTIAIANGGTGQTTATAAFNALSPETTQGDMSYHNGTNDVRLAKGTANQVLTMNAGATAPAWAASAGGGATYVVTTADTVTAVTGYVDITGLSWTLAASTRYEVVCHVMHSVAAATTGFGVGWALPGTPVLASGLHVTGIGVQTVGGTTSQGSNSGSNTSASAVNNTVGSNANTFHGFVSTDATGGTLQMRARFEVADAANTVKAGSWCKYTVY